MRFICSFSSGVGWIDHGYRELHSLPQVRDVKRDQGRIYFSYDGDLMALQRIRSCERLSLIVCRGTAEDFKSGVKDYIERNISFREAMDVWMSLMKREPRDFRVSVKKKAHPDLRSSELTTFIADLFLTALGPVKVNVLRGHFDCEVWLHLNEVELTVSLTLFRQPQSGPQNFHFQGLSQTVSWALCMTADIQDGEVILDPMCGAGIICLEGALTWPKAAFIGMDSCSVQLEKFATNISNQALSKVHILQGDVRRIPLESNCVHAVICDLPYGKQFGSVEENQSLYPVAVSEMSRVLKHDGRVVLLTSLEMRDLLVNALVAHNIRVTTLRPVNLGFLEAVIITGTKSPSPDASGEYATRLAWESANGRMTWNSHKLRRRPPLTRACREK
eukprot:GEMP01034725.1.p1 GENE.GEMP01034725.1~~GEMP01034725.1.p1  ORF type:complete len:389 (+),score=69.54 GEMP01034725.1:81-1247(+)